MLEHVNTPQDPPSPLAPTTAAFLFPLSSDHYDCRPGFSLLHEIRKAAKAISSSYITESIKLRFPRDYGWVPSSNLRWKSNFFQKHPLSEPFFANGSEETGKHSLDGGAQVVCEVIHADSPWQNIWVPTQFHDITETSLLWHEFSWLAGEVNTLLQPWRPGQRNRPLFRNRSRRASLSLISL